jgi:hypothetical protein
LSRRSLFRLFADAPLSLADELRRMRVDHTCRLNTARSAESSRLYNPSRPSVGMILEIGPVTDSAECWKALSSHIP